MYVQVKSFFKILLCLYLTVLFLRKYRINEILFSVCSNDVLFALSSDETSLNIGGNRIARLAQHILQQQSFCPQFPSPPTVTTQVDISNESLVIMLMFLTHSRWIFVIQNIGR